MEETREIIINIAEIKLLWCLLGGVLGFIFCEIKYKKKWDK
tara:strand:- start:206 stop:328 length:123 start_codon:yes stop_codon:yes gene_type:complete